MDNITPSGTLSKVEALKSLRDILVIAVGAAIPQILELASQTNWGEYSILASIILAVIAPLVNRFGSFWRI